MKKDRKDSASWQGSAFDEVQRIAPGYEIATSIHLRFFNRIMLHPIRELRMQRMGPAINRAIRERVGEGSSFARERIKAAAAALQEAMGELKGKALTPERWEHEVRKRTSRILTVELLGSDWRRYQKKKKRLPSGELKVMPSLVARKLPLIAFEEASKGQSHQGEAETRIQLDIFERRLKPAEAALFKRLREDPSLERAAAALGKAASTVRNQWASIEKKLRFL